MGIFDKRREAQSTPLPFDPEAHHKVLAYLRRLWQGETADERFESTSLSRGLGFNSLSMAELIFAVSTERQVPMKRIVHFLRIGLPGGGDAKIATLLERIVILADAEIPESIRISVLDSGLCGDRQEILPIREAGDTVGILVKYCRAIESLKNLQDHDAIDAENGLVEEDPGWQ